MLKYTMAKVDFTQSMKDLRAYLTFEEVYRMLSYCASVKDKQTYMLILTLQRTGRRITEIVGKKPFVYAPGLRPQDIRLEEGLIEWSILKKNHILAYTNEHRKKPASTLEKQRIEKHQHPARRKLVAADHKFLTILARYCVEMNFGSQDRIFPISREYAWKKIKKVAQESGIEGTRKISPKIFRHSMGVNFVKSHPRDPSAIVKLKEILAHSKIDITSIYLQFAQDDVKDDLEVMFNG